MDKAFSLYLDTVRFLAAVLVVVAHYLQLNVVAGESALLIPDLGREAVIAFFVLSGFVIAYVTDSREQSLREYSIARAARIYSVALPVLLLAFLIALFYSLESGTPGYQLVKAYIYIPFHSLFLGELWHFSERPPGLAPYWSLSYEVWYYIFFASVYFLSGYRRLLVAGSIFLIIGYKLWLLMPIWWSGVLLYKYINSDRVSVLTARSGLILSIAALALYKYLDIDLALRATGTSIWPFPGLDLGSADRFLGDYVVCLIIIANFYFAKHAQLSSLLRFGPAIRALAAYTFTLYLVHTLVIKIWLRETDYDSDPVFNIMSVTLCLVVATYALGALTERRKHLYTRLFSHLVDKILLLKLKLSESGGGKIRST